jgi:hypothetical protein
MFNSAEAASVAPGRCRRRAGAPIPFSPNRRGAAAIGDRWNRRRIWPQMGGAPRLRLHASELIYVQ